MTMAMDKRVSKDRYLRPGSGDGRREVESRERGMRILNLKCLIRQRIEIPKRNDAFRA